MLIRCVDQSLLISQNAPVVIAFLSLALTLSSSTVASLPRRSDFLKLPSLGESLTTAKERRNLARVDPVHDHHRNPHDQSVEDVQEHFMNHDEPIVALGVFNHSYDRSHEDQDADKVKRACASSRAWCGTCR